MTIRERLIVAAILAVPFSVFFVTTLMQHLRVRRIVARIKQLKPEGEAQLIGFDKRIFDLLLVYDPFKLNRFLRSGDDLGDERLRDEIRKFPWPAMLSWTVLALAVVFLGLIMILK